ncbi:hypothetical protein CH06BL_28570 [Chromobacterium haemolyticum]|nr:hypothetical protein CH06BL_28570 [Chromobacterium haemolyticum]
MYVLGSINVWFATVSQVRGMSEMGYKQHELTTHYLQ